MPLDTDRLKQDLRAIADLEPSDPPDTETPITLLVDALARFVRSGDVTGIKVRRIDASELPQTGVGKVG